MAKKNEAARIEKRAIQWSNSGGGGVGVVTRAIPKEDAGSDNALVWDVDAEVDLENREQVERIGDSLPGTLELYARAKGTAHDSADVKVRPGASLAHVTVTGADGTALLEDAKCEVRHIRARLTEKGQVQVVRLRVAGVLRSQCLAGLLLGRTVEIALTPDQPDMFEDAPQIGQLVTWERAGAAPGIGLVSAIDGDSVTVAERAANTVEDSDRVVINLASVVQHFAVESADATPVMEHIAEYEANAAEAGIEPTWALLVDGANRAWANGDGPKPGTSTLYIGTAAIAHAVGNAPQLPSEPGDGDDETPAPTTTRRKRAAAEA